MSSLSSEDEWREALITLSQFVYLGDKEFVRDEIHQNAIEICLYLNEDKEPIAYKDLQEILLKSVWSTSLPLKTIEDSCRTLLDEGRISIVGDKAYLNIERREEIGEEVKKAELEKKNIEKLFIDLVVNQYRILADLPLLAKDQYLCIELFWKYLSKLIGLKVGTVAQLLHSSNPRMDVSMSATIFSSLNDDIANVQLAKSFRITFESLFGRRIGIFLSFLFKCSQVLTCWKILSLDPSIEILKKSEFGNKKILLDTNSLIGLVCVNCYNHEATRELMRLSGDLGVKSFVTSKTIAEFKKVLERSNERYALLNVPARILKVINDEFISSYAFELDSDQSLTWQKYYERMVNIDAILTQQYGIEVKDVKDIEIVDSETYEKVITEVSRVWEEARQNKKERDVAEHDAFHLLLIKKLRDEDNIKSVLGPNYWFLTRDSTLFFVNSFINSLGLFKNQISSSIKESYWLDFITPFLNFRTRNKDAYSVFADLLRSEFTTIPKGISPKILTEIQGEWTKYEWLSTNDIEEILKDTVMQTLVSKFAKLDPEDEETKTVIKEMRQHFDTLLSQKFNQKMDAIQKQMELANAQLNSINKSLQEKEQEVGHLRKEVTSLKSDKKRDYQFTIFWRAISGCIGIILVAASLFTYLTNPQPTLNVTIVSCLAIVSGAIFVLMAIAYEQVKARLSISIKK